MAKVKLTAIQQYHEVSDVIGHVDALAILAQAYVDALNAQLAVELKFPDWHEDAEFELEQAQADLSFITNEMAERTTRMLLPTELRAFHNANRKASHERYMKACAHADTLKASRLGRLLAASHGVSIPN